MKERIFLSPPHLGTLEQQYVSTRAYIPHVNGVMSMGSGFAYCGYCIVYNCHGQTVFWPRPTHNEG